jgi:hypothetical protein
LAYEPHQIDIGILPMVAAPIRDAISVVRSILDDEEAEVTKVPKVEQP